MNSDAGQSNAFTHKLTALRAVPVANPDGRDEVARKAERRELGMERRRSHVESIRRVARMRIEILRGPRPLRMTPFCRGSLGVSKVGHAERSEASRFGQHVQYARLEQRVREREAARESLGHAAAGDGGVATMWIAARTAFLRNEPKSAGACHPEKSSWTE